MNALRLVSNNVRAVAWPQGVRSFQSSRVALGPIVKATDDNFKQHLQAKGPILVDFHAEWCGPCKIIDPVLRDVANSTDITLIKVDIDQCPATTQEHEIRGVPTVKAFKDGNELQYFIGAKSKGQIDEFITMAFGK